MWHLFDRYKGVVWPKARQMNLIAKILNNLCAGTGIKIDTPTVPSPASPVTISVDNKWLDDHIGNDGLDNHTFTIYDGGTVELQEMIRSTGDISLQVKRIAAGDGIALTVSNGTITVTNTAPCSCGGGGGGGSSTHVTTGYDGDVVLATIPEYDTSTHQLKYTPVTLTYAGGLLQSMTIAASPTVITTAVEETA